MIARRHGQSIEGASERQAGVVLLGPRQVGKTTIAQEIAEARDAVCLDMERSADLQILEEPDLQLEERTGRLVVIDQVQRMPDLFKALRGQIDRRRQTGFRTGQVLLLGSASDTLRHQSAESLALIDIGTQEGPLDHPVAGAEIDLVLKLPGGALCAIEVKRTTSPKAGRGFHFASDDPSAEHRVLVQSFRRAAALYRLRPWWPRVGDPVLVAVAHDSAPLVDLAQ
jgi:hypothetical protein